MPDVPGETPVTPEQVPAVPSAAVPSAAVTPAEEPFDKDRAMKTISTLREVEKTSKAQEKELAALRAQIAEHDKAKLSEIEKAQLEAKQASEKLTATELRLRNTLAERDVEREAGKLKFIDNETAFLHIQSKIEYDADGKPTNVTALLDELAKSKPHLIQSAQGVPGGAGASSANPARTPSSNATFTRAQLRDPAFYQANKAAINAAAAEGRIID